MALLSARSCATACPSGAPTEPMALHQRIDNSQAGAARSEIFEYVFVALYRRVCLVAVPV